MGKNAKTVAENYRISNVAKTWVELYKFMINELYPLRYYKKERKEKEQAVDAFHTCIINLRQRDHFAFHTVGLRNAAATVVFIALNTPSIYTTLPTLCS